MDENVNMLEERIKELSCLYDIASLAVEREKHFPEILQSIVNRIPLAWRFSQDAVCELRTGRFHLLSGEVPERDIRQEETIFIDDKKAGSIAILYPFPKRQENDFLREESSLLKKLAKEIASIIDRMESREREEAFIRSYSRQDRLSILGEITAGIAHELNTPLGNILGFAQLILDSERNPQTLADAQKIMDSAIHSREIVKKLMFFACELPQRFEFLSVNRLVEEAVRLLRPSLQQSGISIDLSKDASEPMAQLDGVQVTQVIFNLVINAIYASESGSTITISIESDEAHVRISVNDQGKGIPEELQNKIFEPFYTTRPVGEGSGLGLSVVHGIIRAHGGTIRVRSAIDKGTTFLITLPLKQAL